MRHANEYGKRRKILKMLEPHTFRWVYIRGHFEVAAIKKKHRRRTITLQRIRDGTY